MSDSYYQSIKIQKHTMYKKSKSILPALLMMMVCASSAYYSNQDAASCYYQAEHTCADFTQACNSHPECQAELQGFQKCRIPSGSGSNATIFNGYCFRQWWNRAEWTRLIIDCMVDRCNLLYNSVVTAGIMASCTDKLLASNSFTCSDECLAEMEDKVGAKSTNTPIEDIYSQRFVNQEAQMFINRTRQECVSPMGRIRSLSSFISEEESLSQSSYLEEL